MIQELTDAYRSGWSLPFRGEIYDYATNLDLQNGYAIKGQFEVNRSKYLKAPFEAIRNPRRRIVVIRKGVQTGGSLIADLTVPYFIEHAPGDLLWLFQDDDFAVRYIRERWIWILKKTPSLKPWIEAAGKFGIQKDGFYFPHMSIMAGGLNEGNVQSLSKQYVIVDECWLAKSNGLIRQAKARATAYPYTCKIILISQAGIEGEDFDLEFQSSDMALYSWCCPSCKKHQVFEFNIKREDGTWAGMKWDTNDHTRPNGKWNYPRVSKTARLECFHCGHNVDDTPANRRYLDDTHKYTVTNPEADESVAGFWWPGVANPDISFGSVVTKYLKAKEQDEKHGYRLPLMEFYMKDLALSWREDIGSEIAQTVGEDYDPKSEWKDEWRRCLLIDCQQSLSHFWYSAHAVAKNGETRQLARGVTVSFEELAKIQKELNIPDQWVFLDAGHEQEKLVAECARHKHKGRIGKWEGWLCWALLKGSGLNSFGHKADGEKNIRHLISDPLVFKVEAPEGKVEVLLYNLASLHCKDMARRYRDGDKAPKCSFLPETQSAADDTSWSAQLHSEMRIKKPTKALGGYPQYIWVPKRHMIPNHAWDLLQNLMAVLLLWRVGQFELPQQEEEEREAA
jgi:hypothetical protein